MKNKLFSILTVLFILLTFTHSSIAKDLQDDPQQGDFPDGVKVHTGKGSINDIKYSPDGTRLAMTNTKGIWLYDAQTGDALVQFIGFTDSAATIAFSPDGNILIGSGTKDNTIRLWDAHTGKTSENLQVLRIGQGALRLVRMARQS